MSTKPRARVNLLTERARSMARRRRLKAACLCTACGRVPPERNRVRCVPCNAKVRAAKAKYMHRQRVVWKLLGICATCGIRQHVPHESRCGYCAETQNEGKVIRRAERRAA